MIPLKFDGFNAVYRPVEGGPQRDLPAKRDGNVVVTRWQPSYEELQVLYNGGCVELTVHGGQPVVELGVV
jgi:hypothetical protein